jgi:hypothetical protein
MRKLYLSIGTFIIALALIILLAPLAMSFWVAKNYPKTLAQLNIPNTSFKLIKFNRGWFHSTATVQVNSTDGLPSTVIINQKIQNGPVIFAKSGIKIAIAYITSIEQKPPLQFNLDTTWTFANNLVNTLRAKDILLVTPKQKISLTGLMAKFKIDPMGNHGKIHFKIKNFSLNYPTKLQFNMKNLQSAANFKREAGLWFGNREITIKQLNVITSKHQKLTINNMRLIAKHKKQNNASSFYLHYQAALLQGFGYDINPINIKLNITGLNIPALASFMGHLIHTPNSPAAWLQLYDPTNQLIAEGFNMNLNPLQFTTPTGTVTLTASIKFLKQPHQHTSILFLNKYAEVKAHLTVPKKWLLQHLINYYQKEKLSQQSPASTKADPVEAAKNQLQSWINNKIFLPKGSQLELNLQYNQGQLLINGKQPNINLNTLL